MHKAYKKLHSLGYQEGADSNRLNSLINTIKSPSTLKGLKDNAILLFKEINPEVKNVPVKEKKATTIKANPKVKNVLVQGKSIDKS